MKNILNDLEILCTGCGLCQSIIGVDKIKMEMNSRGYLRPKVVSRLTGTDFSKIENICPGVYLKHECNSVPYHHVWGPIKLLKTGFAIDEETRYLGSSGGAISAILIYLLEKNKVDYVLHIGMSDCNPLINELKTSKSRGDVLRFAGSRYSPSSPLSDIDAFLALPGVFAFVGKPCDIAALRNYSRINPIVNKKIPYMISFMCAGVPSLHGTLKILDEFGLDKRCLKSFVYRGKGWPGLTTAVTKEGKEYSLDYETSWGSILNRYLQFRCKICPDGTGEFADIVCGDAWYGKNGYPDFSEKAGRSVIIARTVRGEEVVTAASGEYLNTAPFGIDELSMIQPYQEMRKKIIIARVLALKLMFRRTPVYKKFLLVRAASEAGLLMNIRNLFGTLKRLHKLKKISDIT